jgi:hypothetical protein
MVNACCGSSKILLYDCDQVIVDFDFEQNTFSFIDSKELLRSLSIDQAVNPNHYLVDFFVLCVSFMKTDLYRHLYLIRGL